MYWVVDGLASSTSKLKEKKRIEGLSIIITDLCKKCQTCLLLLMDKPSIVAMFFKLCIYGRNQASVLVVYLFEMWIRISFFAI